MTMAKNAETTRQKKAGTVQKLEVISSKRIPVPLLVLNVGAVLYYSTIQDQVSHWLVRSARLASDSRTQITDGFNRLKWTKSDQTDGEAREPRICSVRYAFLNQSLPITLEFLIFTKLILISNKSISIRLYLTFTKIFQQWINVSSCRKINTKS